MNKKDKKTTENLKLKLEDENIALPEKLSAENIEILLNEQEQETAKKSNIKFRYIATAAAAVVVIAISVTALNLVKLPEIGKGKNEPITEDVLNPDEIGDANIGVDYISEYAEIENVFLKIQKERQKENNKRKISDIFDGVVSYYAEESAKSNDDSTADVGEHGETNVQVEGVDEADIIKNDGRYLYIVKDENPREIAVISILPADYMKVVSTILVGEQDYIHEIYVYENILVAVASKNNYFYDETGEKVYSRDITGTSAVIVYDISDRANPVKTGRFEQDGYMLTTRMVDNVLYLVSTYTMDYYDYLKDNGKSIDEEKFRNYCIPTVGVNGGEKTRIPRENIYVLKGNEETSYLVISAIDVKDMDKTPVSKTVVGAGNDSYCTRDSLYISRQLYSEDTGRLLSTADKTEIYQFELNGMNIRFKNSGKVEGEILNQFSMDEYKGYFRIATTERNESNRVTVLDSKLNVVGEITDIAPGEQIYAVRFMGDTGYVITFEQTDPLFVMDLSDPENPKITGELKIPGFSNYLHPYGDKYLIGIGQTGDENGATNGLKISLFDISDMKNPKEIDKIEIAGASSDARYNHKSVLYSEKLGLIGFDVSFHSSDYEYYGHYYKEFLTFTVKNGRLAKTGEYATITEEEVMALNGSRFTANCRGTYAGDNMYVYAYEKVASFSMKTGKKLDSINVR